MTARSNPHQVLELAETGGLLCPIKALKSYREGRKTPLLGGRPVFTWSYGKLITMAEINLQLAALLPNASIKITTRACSPKIVGQGGSDRAGAAGAGSLDKQVLQPLRSERT